jgi:hypothetical protein
MVESSLVWTIKGRQFGALAHSATSSCCFFFLRLRADLEPRHPDLLFQFTRHGGEFFKSSVILTTSRYISLFSEDIEHHDVIQAHLQHQLFFQKLHFTRRSQSSTNIILTVINARYNP